MIGKHFNYQIAKVIELSRMVRILISLEEANIRTKKKCDLHWIKNADGFEGCKHRFTEDKNKYLLLLQKYQFIEKTLRHISTCNMRSNITNLMLIYMKE